ncbi:hypothetical protein, partial [Candidatus Laterigemmans baculatus]|uniref:hypothetical protein n=1 Tax=Candidatus Laterigemmans baculatus TaxID=2770505 RepID=UPI0013D9920E
MPAARRPHLDDRRRLVIYSQRYSADAPAQGQRTAAVEASLRGARKPVAAYGWRVQRRLRARLFGVVPVRRRTLLAAIAAILGAVVLLALGHWAALWWPPVALRPPLARPLRLDRPDSFGAWFGAAMMVAAAGGSFLIYQLRRYRADDYRGHYRMWRLAIVLCLLASLDAVVHLASWLGAAIDVVLAERDVLAGADWVRLLLSVGGAAFGLRMSVELARCRAAAAAMICALALFGISSATHWNLLRFEAATAVTWLPIALLAGQGIFLTSVVIYLRMLYREVRKLAPSEPLSQRLRKLVPVSRPSRQRRRRGERDAATEEPLPAKRKSPRRASQGAAKRAEAEASEEPADGAGEPSRWRLWLRLGRRKAAGEEASTEESSAEETGEFEDGDAAPRRRRFGLPFSRRRKAAGEEASTEESSAEETGEFEDGEAAPRRKRFGLPFSRRRKAAGEEASTEESSAEETGEFEDG